jgi:hypothetical protein
MQSPIGVQSANNNPREIHDIFSQLLITKYKAITVNWLITKNIKEAVCKEKGCAQENKNNAGGG